jgi:hypothetical protein
VADPVVADPVVAEPEPEPSPHALEPEVEPVPEAVEPADDEATITIPPPPPPPPLLGQERAPAPVSAPAGNGWGEPEWIDLADSELEL